MTAQVIELRTLKTPEERAAVVRAHLAKTEPMLKISTLKDALSYGDQWRLYAYRIEMQLACAQIYLKTSDTLLEFAKAELIRLKGNDSLVNDTQGAE